MNDDQKNELITYRLKKAKETLLEIELHVENELWNTAVNRLYYACYYAVNALLLSINIQAQTHAGVRQMFGLHYIKTGLIDSSLGKFYSDLFDKRQSSDYGDYIEMNRDDVLDFLTPARLLISRIEEIVVEKI